MCGALLRLRRSEFGRTPHRAIARDVDDHPDGDKRARALPVTGLIPELAPQRVTGEWADTRPALRYANSHPATLMYRERVPGGLSTHEIEQRAASAAGSPDPDVSIDLHCGGRFWQWPSSALLI